MNPKRIKDFAREAKLRMLSRRNRMLGYQARNYVLNARLLNEAEVDEIYRKMIYWMDVSPFDILSRLRNEEEWERLNEEEKERYTLQLAEIYRSLRTEYERMHKAT